ncbi:mitochondrial ribonuclease P catalytic subunit [Bombyx mandarina]|uniref:Mitochondrial ribonuclease P catalytic subunit n=1 Tax=Bombyx mandarina TaxID=7092 RepID=A0A6J2K311_BOMMA|nr:mitochondrial ribonuclease P catalytic subunit [Bombyx mandarina]
MTSMFCNTARLAHFGLGRTCRFVYKSAVKEPAPIKCVSSQIAYLESELEKSSFNWNELKKNILFERGNINEKNFEGVLLKFMVQRKKFDAANSFVCYINKKNEELSLGAINGLLMLYYEMSKENKLIDEGKTFILKTYRDLYKKYKVLDYTTSEKLLHALCCIGEWEKALKVLDEINLSSVPSHSAYSTVIATLLKLNKKKKSMEIIEKSILARRPLQDDAYDAWIDYILRKYKDKKIIEKYADEICLHIINTYSTISEITANKIKDLYSSLGWKANYTKITKYNGRCQSCSKTLDCLKLSDEEFKTLQSNIKDKLIIGSDLFLKTSPQELEKFLNFIEKTGPYDIILDALNVSYSIGMHSQATGAKALHIVVEYFLNQNKKVLILGRKHILTWKKNLIGDMLSKTSSFFTDNLSQDDPYIITAAIFSGSHTDIVSKDLLRGHIFKLQDEYLRILFKRWQWQHQWMLFKTNNKHGLRIQPPLVFTPCPQKNNNSWHLPYKGEDEELGLNIVNDGTPNLNNWLCLTPN